MYRVFVGPKQKTIKNTNFFNASITLIGNNKHNNIAFGNDIPLNFGMMTIMQEKSKYIIEH